MNAAEPIESAPGAQAPVAAPVAIETPAAPAAAAPVAPSAPAAAPTPSPEALFAKKQADLQAEAQALVKKKEDDCAAELSKICDKYGCELIVGHSVKVRFKNQAPQQ